ncbi:MAG: aldo/keto reductase [Planctomycetes bacterium]|nr:aldo/keto reductase [Planctomycetota bacterium]
MEYRKLGRSDLEVSVVAMGCWAIVGDKTWGPQDEDDAIAAIETAFENGINFFDTAEAYGDGYSEELLGQVLSPHRKEVVISSKVSASNLKPEDLRSSCEASLQRLQTDYIDVYHIHWPTPERPIDETLRTMEGLKKEGKIRVLACSNFGPRDLTELLDHGRVEANQLSYNLLWRAIEFELQEICIQHDISILAYSPLAQALLTGKFASPDDVPEGRARTRHFSKERPQTRHDEPGAEDETFAAVQAVREVAEQLEEPMADVALAWLISRPGMASVLAGMRNAEQARQNARAGELHLPETAIERLCRATDPLKERMGTNIDMWQTESRLH